MSSEQVPDIQRVPAPLIPIGASGFAFENAEQLWSVAQKIAKSNLKPKGLQTAEDCFLVMAYGQMYGFHPMEALQTLHVVHGKVAIAGEGMAGLIQSHPLCKSYRIWVEGAGDDRAGCVQSWRKGRDAANEPVRFTLAQAKQAGLYDARSKDSAWVKYTDDLLIWKAVARDKRRNWPDAHRKLEVLEDVQEIREERNITPPREKPIGPDPLLAQLKSGEVRTIDLRAPPVEASVRGRTEGRASEGTAGEVENTPKGSTTVDPPLEPVKQSKGSSVESGPRADAHLTVSSLPPKLSISFLKRVEGFPPDMWPEIKKKLLGELDGTFGPLPWDKEKQELAAELVRDWQP